ncbi:MAG: hypothetical protein IPM79_29450 [Polyangiaceae bacterium]|nr:hypothetical protein [Polyangiaceae bacterium]
MCSRAASQRAGDGGPGSLDHERRAGDRRRARAGERHERVRRGDGDADLREGREGLGAERPGAVYDSAREARAARELARDADDVAVARRHDDEVGPG